MGMIFTILYNNYKVINRSLTRLRETNTLNLPIAAVVNGYPFLTKQQVTRLKNKFNIEIIDEDVFNRGLAGGYNRLMELYPNVRYAILYDCDSNPDTKGWDAALMDVIKHEDISYCSLMFDIAKQEMRERGFTPIKKGENVVWRPHAPCVQSVSVADLNYLRSIGGLKEPKKYYGGLESFMWKNWNDNHKLVYIDGFYETQWNHKEEADQIYKQYKWAYAHEGYNGTFEEFINEH